MARPALSLFAGDGSPAATPPALPTNEAGMRINGWPATLTVWTPAEWAALASKPADPVEFPNGLRAALLIA